MSDTNQAVQPQKMARSLKFRIYKVDGLYYPCSENKGVGQLRDYREADLRFCFRICKKSVFSKRGSFKKKQAFRKVLIYISIYCLCKSNDIF